MLALAIAYAASFTRHLQITLNGKTLKITRMATLSRLVGIWHGAPAGLTALLLTVCVSLAVLKCDERFEPKSAQAFPLGSLTTPQNFHVIPRPTTWWYKLGRWVHDLVGFLGVQSALLINFSDISEKPPSWTGLDAARDTELGLTKGATLRHRSFTNIRAAGAFFARSRVEDVNFDGAD